MSLCVPKGYIRNVRYLLYVNGFRRTRVTDPRSFTQPETLYVLCIKCKCVLPPPPWHPPSEQYIYSFSSRQNKQEVTSPNISGFRVCALLCVVPSFGRRRATFCQLIVASSFRLHRHINDGSFHSHFDPYRLACPTRVRTANKQVNQAVFSSIRPPIGPSCPIIDLQRSFRASTDHRFTR